MNDDKALAAVLAVWIAAVLITLGVWGVIIWAIIKVVNHLT